MGTVFDAVKYEDMDEPLVEKHGEGAAQVILMAAKVCNVPIEKALDVIVGLALEAE